MADSEGTVAAYDSVDPAPSAPERDAAALEARLTAYGRPIFERMQALFALRGLGTTEAVHVLGRALRSDPSALLRHEVAYVFGQMGHEDSVDYLVAAVRADPHPMVRHEAVEALGNMPSAAPDALLRKVLEKDADAQVRESAELALDNLRHLRDPRAL
jgi:deoxyhypusine monooxygenase